MNPDNLTHISEEQLVLYYYGEAADAALLDEHLVQCEACRREYQTFQRVLNTVDSAPVPECPEEYEALVWRKLAPRLPSQPRLIRSPFAIPRWVLAGAMAAAIVLAFFAGRFSPKVTSPMAAVNQVRERILLVAVGDHLERSQMVLVELANARSSPEKSMVDISYEQSAAEDLLGENRLYRQTANSTGDRAVAGVLDELERVLLDIAHSPSALSGAELDEMRRRIEAQGILFKVRVIGSQVRERDEAPLGGSRKTAL